jgi:hypothetical protein
MPGEKQTVQWQGDVGGDGMNHCPDDSVLLAYTRQQLQFEEYEAIRQHIHKCKYDCRQKFNDYVLLNDRLDVLAMMQEQYPELLPSLQRRLQKEQVRQRALSARVDQNLRRVALTFAQHLKPGKKLSFVSLPVALLLALLFLVVIVALASRLNKIPTLSVQNRMINVGSANATSVVAHRSVPTPLPTQRVAITSTVSANGSPTSAVTLTPTGMTVSQWSLQVCTTPKEQKQHMLRICGTNFIPGDKVALVVALKGSQPVQYRPVMVDAQGNFHQTLSVPNCKVIPVAIYVLDTTSNMSSNVLLIGDCPIPRLTPAPGTTNNS